MEVSVRVGLLLVHRCGQVAFHISKDGREYLGSAIGDQGFTRAKVNAWTNEIKQLFISATSQPHAAYSAFTHGLSSKWNYLMWTMNADQFLFQPLEDVIRYHFLPAIQEREHSAILNAPYLPCLVRLGGLGIDNPTSLHTS